MLSTQELRSWIGQSGGSYRLIREMEKHQITFISGWSTILGWAGLLSLFSFSLAGELTGLLDALSRPVLSPLLLTLGIITIVTFLSLLRRRPRWRLYVWLFAIIAAGLIIALVVHISRSILIPADSIEHVTFAGGNLIRSVLILYAGFWVMEFEADLGARRAKNSSRTPVYWLGGALIMGLLLLIANVTGTVPRTIFSLFESYLPGNAYYIFTAFSLMGKIAAIYIIFLLMERRLHIISRDGWLPEALVRNRSGLKRPLLLILFVFLLAIGITTVSMTLSVDPAAAIALFTAVPAVVLSILVNLTALVLANHPRAVERRFKLPLGPVIPAVGSGLLLLILFTLTSNVILLVAFLYLIGLIVYLRYGREGMRTTQIGLTLFQETATSENITSPYPVIVAVAHPDTATDLAAFGAAIARNKNGHVMLLQVIEVPEQLPLDYAREEARTRHELLDRVIREVKRDYAVPVEGVTRLSRGVGQGIIDTISEEGAKIVVLGWQGDLKLGKNQLGKIIDEVIEGAACDVAIIRGQWNQTIESILVPVSGGPNAPRAAEIALKLCDNMTLLNIARPTENNQEIRLRHEMLKEVKEQLSHPDTIHTRLDRANSPMKGILDAAKDFDAMLMGASEQGFLDQQWFSPLLIRIANEYDKPIALVRNFSGVTQMVARKAWHSISDIFPTLNKDEELAFYQDMRTASRPSINYFVLIALSAVIATLGLLLNSPAVIIGAMLVAPLMSPIISSAVGIVFGDIRMLRGALLATLQGVLMAIFIAVILTLISPFSELTGEILSRTQPNLLDLMVALASGMAGAYALARKEVGEALPGVAIAAALMPPVCTIGIGLALAATGQASITIALGSLLLFIANLAGIIVSAIVILLLLGIRPPDIESRQLSLKKGLTYSIVFLLIVSLPLGWILFRSVRDGNIEKATHRIVEEVSTDWPSVEFIDLKIAEGNEMVIVSGTLYIDGDNSAEILSDLQSRLQKELAQEVRLDFFSIEGDFIEHQGSQ